MRQLSTGAISMTVVKHICNRRSYVLLALGLMLTLFSTVNPRVSAAQDWGSDQGQETQSQATLLQDGNAPTTPWSVRTGIGFIDDPTALLLNFELLYAFDQWVTVGPMMQVGLDDNNTIIAPTLNVTITIPDLPGENFDRIKPYALLGMGFAYIEDDNRRNDNSSAGFLIDFGVGIEYEISERFFIGTQMMFNFLPEKTLDEEFFFSWQIAGVRLAF